MRRGTTITVVILLVVLVAATAIQFLQAINTDEQPAPVRRPTTTVTTFLEGGDAPDGQAG